MPIVIRLSWLLIAAFTLLACGGGNAPHTGSDPGTAPTTMMHGASGGTGGVHAPTATRPMRDAGECTQGAAPDDEFAVACHEPMHADAGAIDAGVMHAPPGDAGGDSHDGTLDASPPLNAGHDAGSLPPAIVDEGYCAQRETLCNLGRAVTTIGTATCTIAGNNLQVHREVCEACGVPTVLGDYLLTVMDCGRECTPVYSEGRGVVADPLAANECVDTTDYAGLQWSAADPHCVDVYAYVGSGNTNFGWMLEASDQVRVCRCDRTTDTCITCVDHACD